jgi:hypothetical protein
MTTELQPIGSAGALFTVLKAELGYCACAYEDAVPVLHELLRLVERRSDLIGREKDREEFHRVSAELEEWLLGQASGGMVSWMVYTLERAGLLHHGAHVFDLWIQDKGSWLLRALERFPNPQPAFSFDEDPQPDPADEG